MASNCGEQQEFEVCPRCRGRKTIVNPATSVWTRDDIDRDPEAFEDMMAGAYDVICDMCHGERVVNKKDIEAYRERREDARMQARESGDVEAMLNGNFYAP